MDDVVNLSEGVDCVSFVERRLAGIEADYVEEVIEGFLLDEGLGKGVVDLYEIIA